MKTRNHNQNFLTRLCILSSKLAVSLLSGRPLHDASFAPFHQLAPLFTTIAEKGPRLLIGKGRFDNVLAVSPTIKRRELGNMLVVAPTRGGKGLLAISQLLTWPHSAIVNDIKGELYEATAAYRKTLGSVFVLDPQGYGHQYNPLAAYSAEDEFYSAATALLHKPNEGDGAIFTLRAIDMLTQLFLAAKTEGLPPFPYIRSLLHTGLVNTVERLHALSPTFATRFLDTTIDRANFDDKFLLHSFGTLKAKLEPLLTERVLRSLSGSDFVPAHLLSSDKPITIYLKWPERHLLALSPLIRLIWNSLIDELIHTYDTAKGKGCQPVLALIDEAGRTAIPTLADHATTVVGRGISLWIAMQDLSQLETVYGKARAETLRNNMETQAFYRPADQKTAEYLERCLGRKSGFAHSQTSREGEDLSEGRSEQAIPLLTAQHIKQLADEEIIAFHRNLPPIRANRLDWRDFPLLRARRSLAPPPVSPLPPLPDMLTSLPAKPDTAQVPFAPVDPDELAGWPRSTTPIYTAGKARKQDKSLA
jgi:type IV secretion system protein VirD4